MLYAGRSGLFGLGEYAQAVRQIDTALRINPKLGAAEATRALALQRLQRFDEALASYDQAIG
jgi:Flp pilus assembly protein TadD